MPRSSDEGDSIFNDVSGGESDEQELSDWEDPDSDSEGEEETASFELNREHLCHALAHCGYYSSTVPIKKTLKNAFRAGIVCIEYLVTDVKTPDSWNFSKDFLSKTELGDSENDARKLCNIANKLGPDFRILVENATTANKRISAKNAHTAILKTLNMPRETSDGTDAEDESAEKSSAEAPVPKKKRKPPQRKWKKIYPPSKFENATVHVFIPPKTKGKTRPYDVTGREHDRKAFCDYLQKIERKFEVEPSHEDCQASWIFLPHNKNDGKATPPDSEKSVSKEGDSEGSKSEESESKESNSEESDSEESDSDGSDSEGSGSKKDESSSDTDFDIESDPESDTDTPKKDLKSKK